MKLKIKKTYKSNKKNETTKLNIRMFEEKKERTVIFEESENREMSQRLQNINNRIQGHIIMITIR